MKMRTFWIGSVTVLTALAACAAPEPPDTTAADLEAIDATREAFKTAFEAGDAAQLSQLYTEDAVLMDGGQPTISGRAAIRQSFEETFSQVDVQVEINPQATEVDGDLAFDSGTFRSTATPKAGGEAMVQEGRYVVILRRGSDGAWRVARDMGNSPTPPMMPEGM